MDIISRKDLGMMHKYTVTHTHKHTYIVTYIHTLLAKAYVK